MLTFVRILFSAIIIGGVTLVGRRSPALGGFLAAMPLVTVLSVLWLGFDKASPVQLTRFVVGVLWGMIPTALFLVVVVACLRQGMPWIVALGGGAAVWVLYAVAAQRLALFGL